MLALIAVQAGVLKGYWQALVLVFFVLLLFILYFFRNPLRPLPVVDNHLIYAGADGKVVAIEETHEEEYFNAPRIQVSIFMSPLNVHVNRAPLSGEITYYKYHPGGYKVAWHPKSSTENERTTYVLKSEDAEILIRQIAGAMARRIVSYPRKGDHVRQGDELGFIKFGSRFDVLLPVDAEIMVQIGQRVKGNVTVLARV